MRRTTAILAFGLAFTLTWSPVSWAEPTWQFPWPNDKNSGTDPKWEISGYSYGCGTHDQNTGGSLTNPGAWDAKAIDFGLDLNQDVAATADGLVVLVNDDPDLDPFGIRVILDHGGYYSMYAHLNTLNSALNERVRAGEKVGGAGETGTGIDDVHLHFQPGRGTSSSIFAREPEDMTGIRSSNSNYDGWDTLDQWGICGATSPFWFSAPHLGDAVLLNGSTGDLDIRFAKSDGSWSTMEDADTTTYPASITAGFFGTVGSVVDDEVSDLLFYNPAVGVSNRWETWIRRPNTNPPSWNKTDSDSPGEPVFMSGAQVFPAELNGDGLTDIILYDDDIGTTAKYETWLAKANDPGSWSAGASVATWPEGWKLLTGNFNADNLTDVLTYDPNGTGWRVRRANSSGDGGFTTMDNGDFSGCCRTMLVGYFNDDRYSDTFRYDASGTYWSVRMGDGAGNWTGFTDGNWGSAVSTHLVGYFNDGKKSDLLRYDSSTGAFSTKIANGTGGWSETNGTFDDGRTLYLAQLDQDERTDLILYQAPSGGITTRFSKNVGEWTSNQCVTNCSWDENQTLAVAYLDRDANAAP